MFTNFAEARVFPDERVNNTLDSVKSDDDHKWHHCEYCHVGFTHTEVLDWHYKYCKPLLTLHEDDQTSSRGSSSSSGNFWRRVPNPFNVARQVKGDIIMAVRRKIELGSAASSINGTK